MKNRRVGTMVILLCFLIFTACAGTAVKYENEIDMALKIGMTIAQIYAAIGYPGLSYGVREHGAEYDYVMVYSDETLYIKDGKLIKIELTSDAYK